VATGIAPVGDAWACSNPSLGRGMALGLLHVQRLRDVIREQLEDPRQFAEVWNAVTEAELTPWYRETVEEDRAGSPRSRRYATDTNPSYSVARQPRSWQHCEPPFRTILTRSARTARRVAV
jgi:hypothetical protein